jgi:asparagine synthetase B (glutamine-hydrolysing)
MIRDWHGIASSYRRSDGIDGASLRDLVARPPTLDLAGVRAAWGEVDDPYATVVANVRRAPCKVVAPMPLAFGAWTAMFEAAVARVAIAAVEPMLALGGGLDAAAVLVAWRGTGVAMPAVATFATGLASYDEVDLARAIARAVGVTCEVVEVAPSELVARAPMAAKAAATPFYNLHPVHRLVLAQVRGRGGATLVTGDGADAVFSHRRDLDYVPHVVALARAAGLATASPFFAEDLIAATPHDPRKQYLRDYLREQKLGWLADEPKRTRRVPPLDLEPILDRPRIGKLAAALGVTATFDDDRARVGWATLDHLVRDLEATR